MKDFVTAERRGAPRLTLIFLLCVLCASPVNVLAPRENPARIALIAEGDLGDPGNFGADDLLEAFREKGLDSVRTNDFRDAAAEDIIRSEEHTSELQSHSDLVCRLLLEKK